MQTIIESTIRRVLRLALATALFLGVVTVPAAHAQTLAPPDPCTPTHFVSSGQITSSSCVPFTGTFYNSATGEMVNVSGNLLVAASLVPPDPIGQYPNGPIGGRVTFTLLTTLLDSKVTATGASGAAYTVNGSNLKQILFPPNPVVPPNPLGGLPPNPICAPGSGLIPNGPIGQIPTSPTGGHFGFVLYPPNPFVPPAPIDSLFLNLTLQLNNDCTINAAASTVAVDGDQLVGSDSGPNNSNTPIVN